MKEIEGGVSKWSVVLHGVTIRGKMGKMCVRPGRVLYFYMRMRFL